MKKSKWLLLGSALSLTVPAWAGEEPLYRPAPTWVEAAELPTDLTGPPLILLDKQQRIEEGRLTAYLDQAVRIDNPQMLQAVGTIQATWLPDKGDLIVHRVAIVRGGQTIDVLGQGAVFDVLRREQELEMRMLDGVLTATLPVPGLRVGDVLRISYTVTTSDQALDKEVQTTEALMAQPFEARLARVRISWPEDADVRWQASRGVELPEPQVREGFVTVGVDLPLLKPDDVPEDSPVRYRMPALLQAGTFADWQEVSRVMAPHYDTADAIAASGPIAEQVATITAEHREPLARAVATLRLVQDEIAYLADGLDGGNYIPQTPAETWDMRYGDCKAKTLLLVAMLREMGIEAEAVLVASGTGDAVPDMLPMPGAFDHVIVRAVIDGEPYWLDGTDSGASLANVRKAPPFAHALPIRPEGSGLIPIEVRPQQGYDYVARITFDHRAGLDIPMLYEAEFTLAGSGAGPFRAMIDQASEEQQKDFIAGFVASTMGPSQVVDHTITFDAERNVAVVRLAGLMTSPWTWERGRGKRSFGLATEAFEFRPDRSRTAWQEIPVALPGPFSQRSEITVLLPESDGPYSLQGKAEFEEVIAETRLGREARLDGSRLTLMDWAVWPGGELPAPQIVAERAKAARFGSLELTLQSPAGVVRRFELAGARDRSRLDAVEEAYARLIAEDPDDLDNYRNRARFRAMTFDRTGALEDLAKVLETEATSADYVQRAILLLDETRLEEALADADEASRLDPGVGTAMVRANILSYLGRIDEAIALLEEQNGGAEERVALQTALSDLEALSGRKDDGLQRIEQLMTERPGDPQLLNAKCWYQAIWNVEPSQLPELCTEAVEQSEWSPPVLDSRAMGFYRLGRYAEALKDVEAALSASPELVPSLLMRGVIRREMGDQGGHEDIRTALARSPSLRQYYGRFGIRFD